MSFSRGELEQQHTIRYDDPNCGKNESPRYGKHAPSGQTHVRRLDVVNRDHEAEQRLVRQVPVQDAVRDAEYPLLQPFAGGRHLCRAASDGEEDGHADQEREDDLHGYDWRLRDVLQVEERAQGVQEAADAGDVGEEDDERQGVVRLVQPEDDLPEDGEVLRKGFLGALLPDSEAQRVAVEHDEAPQNEMHVAAGHDTDGDRKVTEGIVSHVGRYQERHGVEAIVRNRYIMAE